MTETLVRSHLKAWPLPTVMTNKPSCARLTRFIQQNITIQCTQTMSLKYDHPAKYGNTRHCTQISLHNSHPVMCAIRYMRHTTQYNTQYNVVCCIFSVVLQCRIVVLRRVPIVVFPCLELCFLYKVNFAVNSAFCSIFQCIAFCSDILCCAHVLYFECVVFVVDVGPCAVPYLIMCHAL